MRYSIFDEPANDIFVNIRESRIAICDGYLPAAAVLALIEYKHLQIIENRENSIAVFKALKRLGKPQPPAFREWQFYSNADLERLTLICKKDAINKGVAVLEEKQFIQTEPPDELKELFRTGLKKWFRLDVARLQTALNEYAAANKKELLENLKSNRKKLRANEIESADIYEIIEDWKTVHDRPRIIIDSTDKRYKLILERLKAGFSKERCLLAIRGICLIPHNMGENEQRKIYADLDLLFRTNGHLEKYEAAAIENGLTVENFRDYKVTSKNKRVERAKDGAAAKTIADCDKCDKRGFVVEGGGLKKCDHT